MRFNYRKKQTLKEKYELKKPQTKPETPLFFHMLKVLISSTLIHKYCATAVHTIKIKRVISTNFDASGINTIAYILYRINKAIVRNNLKNVCHTKD